MTDKEINIAIAEAIGERLFVIHKINRGYYLPDAHGYTDDVSRAWQVTEEIAKKHATGPAYANEPDRIIAEPAPVENYCGDLNAMHEAEMTLPVQPTIPLTRSKREIFRDELFALCDQPIHAEARQRAEAFVQTMVKWRGK